MGRQPKDTDPSTIEQRMKVMELSKKLNIHYMRPLTYGEGARWIAEKERLYERTRF